MISVIKWEIWQRRWFIFWWILGIFIFIFINLIFYPSFKDQAAELEKSLASIPESARALFSDTGDFFSPVGYLSSQVFYFLLPMLMGIASIVLGSSLIAREEKEGTIELLLSRPISRSRLLAAKALAGTKILIVIGLVETAGIVVMAKVVDIPVAADNIALATLASTLLAWCFGAVAFAITSLGKARIASVGLATVFALGGYIIASLSGAAKWLKWPAKVFPFHYYQPAAILESKYNWANMLFVVGVVALCAVVSFIAFRRRDISN